MTKTTKESNGDLEKYQDRQPAVIQQPGTSLLEMVIQKGADLQTIEKFMDLQERHEKNEARKAYVVAMTAFKKNPPEILKQTTVSFDTTKGTTSYKHASLDHVTEQINASLSEHGLFASWSQSQSESEITVTCKITHSLGHSEETSLTAGSDLSGNKNAIQGLGSTISYLQRYTILALTGLAAKGMDTDGNLPKENIPAINKDQTLEIEGLKSKLNPDNDVKYEINFKNQLQKEFKKASIDRLDKDQAGVLIAKMKARVKFIEGKK